MTRNCASIPPPPPFGKLFGIIYPIVYRILSLSKAWSIPRRFQIEDRMSLDAYISVCIMMEIIIIYIIKKYEIYKGEHCVIFPIIICALIGYRYLDLMNGLLSSIVIGRFRGPFVISYNRLVLLCIINVIEIILIFTIIYYLFQKYFFEAGKINGPVDAIYFSIVSGTTLGFGDITPKNGTGKILVCIEVLSVTLVAMTLIGSMLGLTKKLPEGIAANSIDLTKIHIIQASDIEQAIRNDGRQYLVGDLKCEQSLGFIKTEELEIGISYYKGGETEEAHYHPIQDEYQIILKGKVEYYDIKNSTIHSVSEGDFFCIPKGVKYVYRLIEESKIMFIKVPSINDKSRCRLSKDAKEWLKSK